MICDNKLLRSLFYIFKKNWNQNSVVIRDEFKFKIKKDQMKKEIKKIAEDTKLADQTFQAKVISDK